MQSITSVGNSQIGKLLKGKKNKINPQVTASAISKHCGKKEGKRTKEKDKGLMRQIAFNYP